MILSCCGHPSKTQGDFRQSSLLALDNEVDETVHSVFLLQELPVTLPCFTAGVSCGVY